VCLDVVKLQLYLLEVLGGVISLGKDDVDVGKDLLHQLLSISTSSDPSSIVARITSSLSWTSRQTRRWHDMIEEAWSATQAAVDAGSDVAPESIWLERVRGSRGVPSVAFFSRTRGACARDSCYGVRCCLVLLVLRCCYVCCCSFCQSVSTSYSAFSETLLCEGERGGARHRSQVAGRGGEEGFHSQSNVEGKP
jgi:hypothetical protein